MVYKFLRITYSDNERIRKKGDNRSMMPLDVLDQTSATVVYTMCSLHMRISWESMNMCCCWDRSL